MTDSSEAGDPESPLDEIPRSARVEDIGGYVVGGFHPLHLGDRIGPDERFEVHHKLGHSEACTIWLCLDRANRSRVGVKVLQAKKSSNSHPEITALRLFDGIDREELRSNRIFPIEEHFWIDGPNGRHLCFVVQVLGPDISHVLEGIDLDTPDLLVDLCLQASQSLKYLHDKKICHGDFRPDHMRLQFDFSRMNDSKVYDLFGEPKVWHLSDSQGEDNKSRPKYLVEPASISRLEAKYRTGQIAIDCFSASHREGDTIEPQVHDPHYAPPEIRFLKKSAGFSSDIWSLGSTIHLVRATKLLLACLPSHSSIMSWLAWAYGPFPREYWNAIGEFLATDSAVPVFTANVIAQKPPVPRRFLGQRKNETSTYPVEWGDNRREALTLLLGEDETPRAIQQRAMLQADKDRERYLRLKLPKDWVVWSKFQAQRQPLTGFKTLLHEDLGKERQWYQCTDPDSEEADYSQDILPGSLDDAVLQRLNGTWNPRLSVLPARPAQDAESRRLNTYAPNKDADDPVGSNKKRRLTEGAQPNPKKAKIFVAKRDLRDQVECVEQFDGMTKYSYRLQAAEVDLLADLLGKMLKNDPKDRIGVDEVLQHEWFGRGGRGLEKSS
ncbi:kinase-like domain-containing protein [Xylaria intraflava]|nr:kinase-like domain-containing protein [Xylaria intraflava]